MNLIFKQVRRLAVLIIGVTVILIGLVLFFLPGPAIVVIPIGLAILATEFVWAQRLLIRCRRLAMKARDRVLPSQSRKAKRSAVPRPKHGSIPGLRQSDRAAHE